MYQHRWTTLAVAAAAALIVSAPQPAKAQISVLVNEQPVLFDSVKPAQISGRVFIPLRKVSEALGAEVRWDAATRSVHGVKGDREFNLPIGDRIASINGQPVTLDVPAQIAYGTTMVPLRFVAEALGADVTWSTALRRVTIRTGDAPPDIPAPAPERGRTVRGEVVGISPRAGTIQVLADGRRVTYRLDRRAESVSGAAGERGRSLDLDEIQIGDPVLLSLDDRGELIESLRVLAAERPAGRANEVTGEVVAIRATGTMPSIVVRSAEGRIAYDLPRSSVLLRPDQSGRTLRTTVDQIKVGDQVRLTLEADGDAVRVLEVVTAQEPVASPQLRITSFTHSAESTLRAGERVDVVLVGTPGAEASVDAGSVARNVPLREDPRTPGRYTGSFVVPEGTTAQGVAIIGQLRRGMQTAPLIQAARSLDVDSEPPAVRDMGPSEGATITSTRPDIYAEISDGAGSGVDTRSVRMIVAGQDVSQDLKVTPRFILYTPARALPQGAVPVQLMLRDKAGNQTTSQWQFQVRPRARSFESISHDAQGALRPGDVLTVTARAPRGSRLRFSLGDVAKDVAMRETQPGVYVGRYTIQRADQADRAPVIVELIDEDGQVVREEASAPVVLGTRTAQPPRVLGPVAPVDLDAPLVVSGTAQPNATVQVQVDFTGRAFGAIPVNGTLGSQEVKADARGSWKTEPFEVRLPLATNRVVLKVEATEVTAAGVKSQPATVQLRTR